MIDTHLNDSVEEGMAGQRGGDAEWEGNHRIDRREGLGFLQGLVPALLLES